MIQLKWARELSRVFPMDEIILTKEYLKEFLSSLAIRKMQTKTTLRFHLGLLRELRSTKQLITLLLRLWGWGTHSLLLGMQIGISTMQISTESAQNTKSKLTI